MAGIARTSGFGNYAQGTVYGVAQLKAFLVTVENASNVAQSLAAEDDAANEVMEAIMREVQPLMYYSTGTDGTITVVCDGHATTAADIQVRIRALGTAVGPNTIDVTGTDVVDAGSLVAAA